MGPLSEFDLVRIIKKKCTAKTPGLVLGIGDDTAVIEPSHGMELLATADTLVEGVHFLTHTLSPFQLGKKALAVNISDIAAMGGIPRFALLTLALPGGLPSAWVEEFYDGLESLALEFSLTVVGGDISRSLGGVSISVTLLGEVEAGRAIYRSGARINDHIFTTGNLGDSGAGLELILSGENPGDGQEKLVKRHLEPVPRVSCGRFLSSGGFANSCIDLSDGLSSDIHQVCEASGVGAVIYEEKLPLSPALTHCGPRLKNSAASNALNGGEDYELLFTVPQERINELLESWPGDYPYLTDIGRVVAREKGVSLLSSGGKTTPLAKKGFDHFQLLY